MFRSFALPSAICLLAMGCAPSAEPFETKSQSLRNAGVEGYTIPHSVDLGGTIALHASASSSVNVEVYRFGRLQMLYATIGTISPGVQSMPSNAFSAGAGWPASLNFAIPTNWPGGLYAFKLTEGSTVYWVPFIVHGEASSATNVAVLAATNTWQAYNCWGGGSLYTCDGGKIAAKHAVHYDRPYLYGLADPTNASTHTTGGEVHTLRWLENNGVAYDLYSDRDFHESPNLIDGYAALLVSTHSEYWSSEMRKHLDDFLDDGGTLLYLNGNGIYWKTTHQGAQIEVRKDGSTHAHTGETGGLWRDLGLPESAVTGVQFDSSSFSTCAPFEALDTSHWAFDRAELVNGDKFGTNHALTYTWPLTGQAQGCASGWEMDSTTVHTPPGTLLARGTNDNGPGADMYHFDHSGGGFVFSAGSLTYGASLVVDPELSHITRNTVNRAQEGWNDFANFVDSPLNSDGFYLGWKPHVGDFDGDGHDDVLWDWADIYGRSRGYRILWYGTSTGFTASYNVNASDGFYIYWRPIVADFDGDGTDDILWDYSDVYGRSLGYRNIWHGQTQGGFTTAANTFGQNGYFNGWKVHVGDFDADGAADMLWDWADIYGQSKGTRAVWLSTTGGVSYTLPGAGAYIGWRPFVGDFDGTTGDDLLWITSTTDGRSTGYHHVWQALGNGTFVAHQNVGGHDGFYIHWRPFIGDFDGDGDDDIVWDYSTAQGASRGHRNMWLGDPQVNMQAVPDVLGVDGAFEGWAPRLADFDGDGAKDLLWYTGGPYNLAALWQPAKSRQSVLRPGTKSRYASGGFRPHVGDFDGDGRADILWDRADAYGRSVGTRSVFYSGVQ